MINLKCAFSVKDFLIEDNQIDCRLDLAENYRIIVEANEKTSHKFMQNIIYAKSTIYTDIYVIDDENKYLYTFINAYCAGMKDNNFIFDSSLFIKTKLNFHKGTPIFTKKTKFNNFKIYHPDFGKLFCNDSFEEEHSEKEISYKVKSNQEHNNYIQIENNNIEKIYFCGKCSAENDETNIKIKKENYMQIDLTLPITYKKMHFFIKIFNSFIHLYTLNKNEIYKTEIIYNKHNYIYNYVLKSKIINKDIPFLRKMKFEEFIKVCCNNIFDLIEDEINCLLPFVEYLNKRSIEDEFLLYYRFIENYYKSNNNPIGMEKILNHYINIEYINISKVIFKTQNVRRNLPFELFNLRNHYLHEGYYIKNSILNLKKGRNITGTKKITIEWLYNSTKLLKQISYSIMYNKILSIIKTEDIMKYL